MNRPDSWKVFNALAKTFADAEEHGATPHDFCNFLNTVRNGMPGGDGQTVLELLARDDIAQHEQFLVDHAKEELSCILQ